MIKIFKRFILELFEKIEDMSDIEMFYEYMSMHPTMFLNEYRDLMRQELIKRYTCPDCHYGLVNNTCPKCKVQFEEGN